MRTKALHQNSPRDLGGQASTVKPVTVLSTHQLSQRCGAERGGGGREEATSAEKGSACGVAAARAFGRRACLPLTETDASWHQRRRSRSAV